MKVDTSVAPPGKHGPVLRAGRCPALWDFHDVNPVHPGAVQKDLHSRVVPQFAALQSTSEDESWEWFRQRMPLGRFQTLRDPGEMVAVLASDRARNITGAAFNVDGGWEMH